MSEREGQVMSRVIKRNGEEVSFDLSKIVNAIKAANEEVDNIFRMNEYQIQAIANDIAAGAVINACCECGRYSGHGRDRHHEHAWI